MHNKATVLITDAVHPNLLSGLTAAGFECHYLPEIDSKKVPDMMASYEGIIINSKINVDKNFLDKSPNLKFVARLGSGLEIIDLDYAREKGVLVHRSPDGNCDAVAEHAMGMLLSLANNLCIANSDVRKKIWRREALRGWEIMGKCIGIIGFGYTGTAFAKRLNGFSVKTLVFDKYRTGYSKEMLNVEESTMEQMFDEADVVSIHLPLTAETKGLVNDEFLFRFKKPVVLINTARGEIVKTDALLRNLDNGKVLGACLDVFENEKPETYTDEQEKLFEELYGRPNVLLSPHIAGWTHESKERLSALLLKRIIDKTELC
jgi:D-3-phosphoglycerate dehydrogenase